MKRFATIFLTIVILVGTLQIAPQKASALTLSSLDSLAVDSSLVRTTSDFKLPSRIVVVPIFFPTNEIKITDAKWLRGLYYYMIERLGFSTIPMHYIITSKGDVYNISDNDERKVGIQGLGDSNVVIGYLADQNSSTFSANAQKPLQDLLLDIANRNDIKPDNIIVSGLKVNKDPISNEVTLVSQYIFGLWGNDVQNMVNAIKPQYSPRARQFNIEVTGLTLTSDPVLVGSEVDGKIKIKNDGPDTLYGGTDSSLVATKADGSSSNFFMNGVWLSKSQFEILPDTQIIAKGQEAELPFKLKTSLFTGNITENYIFKTPTGTDVTSKGFQLTLNVTKGNKRIVVIKDTETNFLRVHSDPSTVAPETGRVESGGRYLVVGTDDSGFIQIDLGDGTTGWIAGWLTYDV